MTIFRPTKLTITDAVTIHSDGRTEVNPAYTTEEAAKVFWDLVVATSPFQSRDATLDEAAKVNEFWAEQERQRNGVLNNFVAGSLDAAAERIRALKGKP